MTAHETDAAGPDVATWSLARSGKIATRHLARQAMVYVRQSSARQVQENVRGEYFLPSADRLRPNERRIGV